ncbi:MAG: hypothetical protein E7573_03730 [Ruminococcaceae bacterium]|nr:hypothetical protein [Oscillospiraceae bacterium]
MKIAKKSLSMFLSLLMIFTACSVGFNGAFISAAAATADEVKTLVAEAVNVADIGGATGDKWSYTVTSKETYVVLEAAQAIYDYAVEVLGARSINTEELYAEVIGNLGFAAGTEGAQLVKNIISPSGSSVYNSSNTTYKTTGTTTQAKRYTAGQAIDAGQYTAPSGLNAVAKSATITVDEKAFLLSYDSIEAFPENIVSSVSFSFNNTTKVTATANADTVYTPASGSGTNKKPESYSTSYTVYLFHVIDSKSTSSSSTPIASNFEAFVAAFTDEALGQTRADLLKKTEAELESEYDTAYAAFNSVYNAYGKEFIDHFYGDGTADKIIAYMADLTFAERVVRAIPSVKALYEAVNTTYDETDYDAMYSLYVSIDALQPVAEELTSEELQYIVDGYSLTGLTVESVEAFKAELYLDMETVKLEEIKASVDADIEYYLPLVQDNLNFNDISDDELATLPGKFQAYAEAVANYSYAAQNRVFSEGYSAYVAEILSLINEKLATREANAIYLPIYDYFSLIFTNFADWANGDFAWEAEDENGETIIVGRYEEDLKKLPEIDAVYNEIVNKYGKDIADAIVKVTYEGEEMSLKEAVEKYLDVVLDAAKTRVEETLTAVNTYADAIPETEAYDVNFSNVVELGTALLKYSEVLYTYMDGKGVIDSEYDAIAAKVNAIKEAYDAFIATGGLGNFVKVEYDENGIYTVRYAGMENDLAREGEEDNYEVTDEKIEAIINKLDGFITSEEFCSLVGLADEEGNPYTSLNEAVNGLIGGLFTDDIINTIIGALFPMITNLLETEIPGLIAGLGGDEPMTPTDTNASAAIDFATLDLVDGLSGKLDIYLDKATYNGTQLQRGFADVFGGIGVNLYPKYLAQSLANSGVLATDSDFYKAMIAANDNWVALAVDPTAEEPTYEFDYAWGITDYESFTTVLGAILDALKPLLGALLGNQSYNSGNISNVGYAKGNASLSILNAGATAQAGINLTVHPINVFDKVWIPIMEALNLTEGEGAYALSQMPADPSGKTAVKALLDPLFALLDKILAAPVNEVVSLLPSLAYALSMDKVQGLLNDLSIYLSLDLVLENIELSFSGLAALLNPLASLITGGLEGTPINVLTADEPMIALGDELDLKDMLGVDYRNLNELIGMLASDIYLPPISQTDLIFLADVDTNAPSYRSSGSRIKFTADKADVLYFLLDYLAGALNEDLLNSIIGMIQGEPEEGEEAEPVEIPAFVFDLLGNVNGNTLGLITVLSEIFVPQTYSMTEIDWYESSVSDAPYNAVYLKYGTDWTREDAVALVENLDSLLKTILDLAGTDLDINTYLPELINGALEGAFTNSNLTTVISGIASLGKTEMDAMLADILADVLGADLAEIYNAFGYLFVTEEEMAEEGFVAPLTPADAGYVNNTGVEAVVDAEGNITWTFGGEAMTDGDRTMFFNILFAGLSPFMPTLEKLLTGGSLEALGILEIPCYDGYAYTFAQLLEVLGVEDVLSQAEFEAICANEGIEAALISVIDAVFSRLDEILTGSVILNLAEILPNLLYFIESNGLSAFVRNLLKPVLVLIDSLRPLVDVDINAVLTYFISELANGKELALDVDVILNMIFKGEIPTPEDPENYKTVAINITDLRLSSLLKIADAYLGTNLYNSPIVNPGLDTMFAFTESYVSATGETAYRTNIEIPDALTVLISALLESLISPVDENTTNADVIFALIEDENIVNIINAVISLIGGSEITVDKYRTPNWAYMYDGEDALRQLIDAEGEFPVRTGNAFDIYTQYQNNWSKETAEYINSVLDMFVKNIVDIAKGDGSTLGTILDDAIVNGIYTDSILNSIIEAVVGLIVDYEDIIVAAGGLLDAQGLLDWIDWCEITENEDGTRTVKCVKDWGMDSAETNEAKKEAFVEGFVETLKPAYRLLAWLLFGEDITFFDGVTKEALITITGGEGYKYAFVPLLEALGATMNYEGTDTGIKPVEAFYEDGVLNMEQAVRDIFSAVVGVLSAICGDLQNVTEGTGTLSAMLEIVPNVFYFINAGGLKAVVNNLLLPVTAVTDKLGALGLEVDFATLIPDINITSLDFPEVFKILENLLPLYFPQYTQDFLSTFYMGKAEAYTSANGQTAYKMVFTEDETRADFITVVISFVADAFADSRNEATIKGWFGADNEGIYDVLMAYFTDKAVKVPMAEFEWALTDKADTGEVLSPVTMDSIYSYVYGELYTREMGEYIEKWLPDFVDTMIVLLGIQDAEGENYTGLEDVLDTLVGTSVYKPELVQQIADAVNGLIGDLKEGIGEEFYAQVTTILKNALGVDISVIETFTVAEFAEGDREAFVNELLRLLAPVYPVLSWLLTDDSLSFFHTADGTGADRIIIRGAEGYKYGIIPILEALGCEDVLTYEEYKADATTPEALLRNIIEPILNKVDVLLADPVNEVVELLPGVIYFLNSNGLDTAVRNVLNAVFSLLETIEPIAGEIDLFEVIGFDFKLNIEDILGELLEGVEEDTGFRLKEIAMEAVNELTVGEIVSFTSKNGLTAYTMKYATGGDSADMISVILRLVLAFVSEPENVVALEAMLYDNLSGEGYTFLCSLLENFSQMAAHEGGMEQVLYTVYQIFYAANVAAHKTNDWLDNFNGDFSFLNQLFATSDLPFLKDLGASLGELLDRVGDGIFDSDGLASEGLIKFFTNIIEFFKKIVEFFKSLFVY